VLLSLLLSGAHTTTLHPNQLRQEPNILTSAGSLDHANIQEHPRKGRWDDQGARPAPHLRLSSPAGTFTGGPSHPRPEPTLTLWGSRFLSADVGVLRPGVATRPAVLIDIATGVRPGTRLERVVADMRLQLAEVIIHHGPSVLASGGLLTLPRLSGAVRRCPSAQMDGLYPSAAVSGEQRRCERLAVIHRWLARGPSLEGFDA
jgi:hypothetical protein